MKTLIGLAQSLCCLFLAQAQVPENLVVEDIPPIPQELREEASRYLESRAAAFQGWHLEKREMLITTRFADTTQLHRVAMPGGTRYQLTFSSEPVASGTFRPGLGGMIVFLRDVGGGEFYQLYRCDLETSKIKLLTDGNSRNSAPTWAPSGKCFAYTSTRRNGADTDIYVMNPAKPESDRLVLEVTGGGWRIQDWSEDETQLLLVEYLSINKSHLHLLDLKTGERRQLTANTAEHVAFGAAAFAQDGQSFFVTTDLNSEFMRLMEFQMPKNGSTISQPRRVLTAEMNWDVDDFAVSRDGKHLAFVVNENGAGALFMLETESGRMRRIPNLPMGVISNPQWHENNRDLGFSITSSKFPSDAFSLNIESGKLERWTQSETGGLDPAGFAEAELVTMTSFDGLEIAAFVYRPDAEKFPGKRPVVVSIHGGPESQARPVFQARNNYYMNELGLVLIYPNVRGSSGFGKTFLTLDNAFKREDSVKDIGTVLDWIEGEPGLDSSRVAVMGGSYGGYMVLASMQHYADRLRCGVDVVGISNFLTFLKNTQDYRRDLRRVEYGDERDESMREFLAKISPTANVERIRDPLLIIQGQNDPRVPVTESEQMVEAIRANGGTVWYLMAKDEGHGFRKKKNADFQFLVTILFFREHLLN